MELILCILWGLITLLTMLLTKKFFIPYLETKRKSDTGNEAESNSNLQRISFKVVIIISVVCSLIAAYAGYRVAGGIEMISGLIIYTLISCVLSCIFVTDMQLKIIPNIVIIVMLGGKLVTLVIDFITDRDFFVGFLIQCIITAIVCLLITLLVSKITHNGIGFGDVKLLCAFGFLCGIKALLYSVIFAFLFASVLALVLMIVKKKTLKDSLPFGPMLWVGFHITAILCLI